MSADGVWQQYAMYRDALNASGRQVYFQMCNTLHYDDAFPELRGGGGFSATMRPWAAQGRDVRTLANGVFIQCELLGIPAPSRLVDSRSAQATNVSSPYVADGVGVGSQTRTIRRASRLCCR